MAPPAPVEFEFPEAEDGVSLVMIVKNEEKRLGTCLASVRGLFRDMVVVDTGSTDRTVEIAREHGARVVTSPWADSFSAARNAGLRHARCKWVMWLDGDDVVDEENYGRLERLFASLADEMDAYAVKVRSAMDPGRTSFRLLDQVRLFRRHPLVSWTYRCHEQTLPAVARLGGTVRWTDAVIDHLGYQEAAARRGKLERNLRLLEMDYAEHPDDAFTLFNLGWTLMDLGRSAEALKHLRRSLERTTADLSIMRKLYHLIAVCCRLLGRPEEALGSCREGLKRFGDDSELLLEEAQILLDRKDPAGAEADLLRLVETRPGAYFASVDEGTRGFRTRHHLARMYLEQRREAEAEVQLRAAVQERPAFVPVWLDLGELFIGKQRWGEVEGAVRCLEQAGCRQDAGLLWGRSCLVRKDFSAARRVLEECTAREAGDVRAWLILSAVLLQEGKDWDAAERVLRRILELDPNQGEARRNLEILLRQLGKAPGQ